MKHSQRRSLTRASVRAALLMTATFGLSNAPAADLEETQTAVTGTENLDTLAISTAQNADAVLASAEGGTISATATGVDALGGDDTVNGNAAIAATADASAAILALPKPGTVDATSTGVSTGGGNDRVEGDLEITAAATAQGAYAGAIDWSVQNPTEPPQKKIEAGVTTNATATGIDTGEGDDDAGNDAALTISADAVSGGGAAPLSAETNQSTEVQSTSEANATATAFDTGAGSDNVTNNGAATNSATATSGALTVSLVAPQGGATDPKPGKTQIKTEATARATATAVGVDTDGEEPEESDEDTREHDTSGLRYTLDKSSTAVAGDDTVTNNVLLDNTATALAGAGGATISNKVDGTLSATANAEATADTSGVITGGGNDVVANDGLLRSHSTATAGAVGVAIDIGAPRADGPPAPPGDTPTPPDPSEDRESKAASNTRVTATASATGINTEAGSSETLTRLAEITRSGILLDERQTTTAAAGNDVVTNNGGMETVAEATVDSLNASLSLSSGGSASADSSSNASAEATGITTGAGNDEVTNAGEFTVRAASMARAATLALAAGSPDASPPSGDEPAPTVSVSGNTSVESSATAMGIDTEGQALSTESTRHLAIDHNGLLASRGSSQTGVSGDDVVSNSGVMSVNAEATAGAGTAAAALGAAGSVSAEAGAQATASSTLIYMGGGNDVVTNTSLMASEATATAAAVTLSVAASKPAPSTTGGESEASSVSVKSGSSAIATNMGIDTEGIGHDSSESESLSLTRAGLQVMRERASVSQRGADQVTNSGELRTYATATSVTASIGAQVGAEGSVSAESDARADATNTAIYTGGGDDQVVNDGLIQSTADATAASISLAVSVSQPGTGSGTPPANPQEKDTAKTEARANAEAVSRAVGIDTDGEGQDQESREILRIDGDGLLVSSYERIDSAGGHDELQNLDEVNASATSRAGAGALAVGIQSDGPTSASTTATARARSGALLTGSGSDSVTNEGSLISTADSLAGAVSLAFAMSNEGGARARSEANATSEATAVGISTAAEAQGRERESQLVLDRDGIQFDFSQGSIADIGVDRIENSGDVIANAGARSISAGVSVAIDGAASAETNARATSSAAALDAGGGPDQILNLGHLDAGATSTSYAISASIGTAGSPKTKTEDVASANSTAGAESFGIRSDNGRSESVETSLTINSSGLSATANYQSEDVASDDIVMNAGRIDSSAFAGSHAGSLAVAIDGVAKADVNSTANTTSRGIDSGGGSDVVNNQGIIVSDAMSRSEAVGVGVGANRNPGGKARVETNSAATASSTGISTDGAGINQGIDSELSIDASGLRLTTDYQSSLAAGNDTLTNRNAVTANADADAVAASIAVSIKGSASASAKSSARADATALNSGAGTDEVSNTGALNAHANAGAITLEASVSKGGSATSTSGILSAGTEASARATGIAAAGTDASERVQLDEEIDFGDASVSLSARHSLDAISTDGADTVSNSGAITATSDVSAIEVTAGITTSGTALTMSRTTSEASATGIDTGHLGDTITNSAALVSTAQVDAVAVKASVTGGGAAIAANAVWDGGTQVTATSRGIDADGGERVTRAVEVVANENLGRVRYTRETAAASGDDTVRNSADISTSATSQVISASAAANAGSGANLALTVSTSTAEADAIAIRGGDGSDLLVNQAGTLNATADATAATVNVAITGRGVAGAADAVWDGGTKASANAIGIAGDGGERSHTRRVSIGSDGLSYDDDGVLADGADAIDNDGAVNATANALAASVSVALTSSGVAIATATSTSSAKAAAIDAGQGTAIDDVTNRGSLTASADAQAYTASVSVVNNGAAIAAGSVWDGGTKAESRARGIDVGAGGETVTNSGAIESSAFSNTIEVAVAAAVNGFAAAVATTTGNADATAIDASAGDDVDHVTNDAELFAHATSKAISAAVTFTNNGVSLSSDGLWDGGTHSTARARGIDVGAGADTLTNSQQVRAEGDALGVSASFAASVNGVAVAATTATTLSDVAALDAGAGDARDTLTNSGRLIADSRASAAAASLSVTLNGAAVAAAGNAWDGGTSATANATGAILGGGDDVIVDSGGTSVDADAFSLSASVGLTMNGLAAAISAAQADANAKGIDAGAGNDSLTTSSAAGMRADANSDAYGIALTATQFGVSASGNNTWDGGTQSRANAQVLDGGAGMDTIDNSSALSSTTFARSLSAAVALNAAGVAVANSTATATADAAAIDGGADADDIDNSAALTVNSQSEARGINVSITGGGAAIAADSVWDGGTTANALGHGIRGGDGNDTIDNLATAGIDSHARAEALSVAVSITGVGFAGATSTSTANAEGAAIDAGAGNDVVNNAATVTGTADATATSVAVSVAGTGAAVATDAFWDGGTQASAVSSALAGGSGNDTFVNTGNATADSESDTLSAAISLSLSPSFGLAAASSASTSTSIATVLDGGTGDDTVSNSALLTAQGSSTARGISVALTTNGAAVVGAFDAATRALSSYTGIGGGDGADSLTNQQSGLIALTGSSDAFNVGVALSLSGASSATATSESVSRAAGLDGGAGNDTLLNAGNIIGGVNAITDSLAVSVVAVGVNGADANARSLAAGAALAGGAGDDRLTNRGTVNLTHAATGTALAISANLGGVRLTDASVESATDSAGLRGDDGADVLDNFGSMTVNSNATTRGQSITAGVTGVSVGTASSVANLHSAGLSGGAGDDIITNHAGALIRTSDASRIESDSLSITVGGVANADARSIARSNSVGISGGTGNDTLANAGAVDVIVRNSGDAASASINVTGAASARAGVEVDVMAKGIDGGDGDDAVTNTGTISVGPGTGQNVWMATLEATPTSLSITGSSDAQSATMARTRSIGIDGGAGADRLLNQGQINVSANALTTTTSGSLNIFGSASGGGESGAFTEAAGLEGGAGDDLLGSTNALNITAHSALEQGATSFSFFGGGSTNAELVAQTLARGISGGEGADTIATDGTITVNAISDLNSTGGGDTVFGGSSSVGKVAATTTTLGIDGGTGDDLIDSLADITLTADSNLRMNNSSYTFGGSGDTGGILAAITRVDGITGGDGTDHIGNSGNITLTARSTLDSLGDSRTTFGSADDTVTSGGVSHASALSGGTGDDLIENRAGASLDVTATTTLNVRSMASTFASNGPGSDAALNGESTAAGMSGEAGNDRLLNRGSITVKATASLANSGAASTALAGVGSTTSTGNSTVVAKAMGFSGGDGNDWMDSIGDIEVRATGVAESVNDAASDYAAVSNDNEAGARTRATVTAVGVDGGAGTNQSTIGGTLTVVADSTSYSLSNASGADFSFSSGAGTYASSNAIAQATGVTGQTGDDAVVLDADTKVDAIASTAKDLVLKITVRRDVRSNDQNTTLPAPPVVENVPAVPNFNDANNPPAYNAGDVVFVRTPPNGERDPNLPANANGAHYQLRNTGTPSSPTYSWVFLASGLLEEVELQFPLSSFPSYAASNGAGIDGDGGAFANGIATATANGFDGGTGNNSFTQFGALDVTATATGMMFTSADADGFGHSQSEATGNAVARAFGVLTGNGDDTIRLGGDVSVTATPIAQARAHASSDTLCIWFFGWWCGDIGSGESKSFVNVTGEAAGVLAGGGNNRITIDEGASLTVISRPTINSYEGDGQFSTLSLATDGEYNEVRSSSIARGIETGDGNDEITNRGDIVVEAWDLASACTRVAADCNRPGVQVFQDAREATGIRTYGGDDVVRNFGTLRVELASRSGNQSQLAIDTGNGNDTLVLGDQSLIVGQVTLGTGDDTLELYGTPVVRNTAGTMLNVDLAGGTDTLVLHGFGAYDGVPTSIERAVKRDAGTYTLGSLADNLQSVAIEDGTLRVNSSYTFADAGMYSTFFDVADGSSGVFSVSGDATLAGAIDVERRGDLFVAHGTRWNLVHADGALFADFDDITLPESRPLLSFELERTAADVDVVARAPSFAVVTDNPLLQQIASNLDGLASRTADFRSLFGRLQNMDGGFDPALKSFSPESHQATAGSALTYSRELNQALRMHLGEARTRYRIAPHTVAPEVAFSFSGGGGGIGQLQLGGMPVYAMNEMPAAPMPAREAKQGRRAQGWMLGISARTDYDELAGFSGFETRTDGFLVGADHRIGDEWLVGASLASGETDIDVNELSGGEIDTWQASLYATWFNDRWHVEGGASFGEQRFFNERWLAVGDDVRTVGSHHDGSVWSAFLGAGTRLGNDRLMVEPYVSFNYFSSDEEGFFEYGALDMSQQVAARNGTALSGEAGFKFSILQHTSKSLIDWHLNLGWNHDFEIGDGELTYAYHGAPDSWFTMDARPSSANSRILGGGVTFMQNQSALTLEYRGLSNDDHDEQYVGARLSLRF